MIFGVLFTLIASAFFSLSNLLQKRAVDQFPAISVRRPARMLVILASSRLWVAGFLAGVLAVVFMVAGYSLAPITVIQSIYGIGLVALVIASHVHLHETLSRREWISIGVIIVAAVLISVTLGASNGPGLGGSTARVLAVSGGTVAVAVLVFFLLRRSSAELSIPFGVASGLIYGTGSLQIKSASVYLDRFGLLRGAVHILESPYPYLFVVLSLIGLVIFQMGLQRSRVAVIGPITNIVAAGYVVGVGMVIFNEPLPRSAALSALRFVGFALVLAASAVFAFARDEDSSTRREPVSESAILPTE